jgi:hypothetical protein
MFTGFRARLVDKHLCRRWRASLFPEKDSYMFGIVKKVIGSKNERELKRLQPLVQKINQLEPEMQKLTDEQLKAKTASFASSCRKAKPWTTSCRKRLPWCGKLRSGP